MGIGALGAFLDLGIRRGAAQIADLPAVGFDLLPVVATLDWPFGQNLCKGWSCREEQQQGVGRSGPPGQLDNPVWWS